VKLLPLRSFLVAAPQLLPLLILLAGCAHTQAPKAIGTPALEGEWQLVDVKCSTGRLGEIGANVAVAIHTRAQDERYIVDENGAFTWRVRERGAYGGSQESYCETLFTGTFSADGHTLHSSGAKFESRKPYGGYQCYELKEPPRTDKPSDHAYELGGRALVIHHKSPEVRVQGKDKGKDKVYKGCEDGSEMLYILEKQ
jgi:hypothetical protein